MSFGPGVKAGRAYSFEDGVIEGTALPAGIAANARPGSFRSAYRSVTSQSLLETLRGVPRFIRFPPAGKGIPLRHQRPIPEQTDFRIWKD
jgi:hypothetical protein